MLHLGVGVRACACWYYELLYREALPAQTVDATLAWSLLAGVWNPNVFLGR